MWQEVRIPWVLLFGIAISAAMKQYETIGYVTLVRPPCCVAAVSLQGHAHTAPRSLSQNMAFMVLATGLCVSASCPPASLSVLIASAPDINACAKGEECIPQTIDM